MEDRELLQEIKKGNREAFERLVRKYQKRAIGFAFSLVGNWQDAEDLSQDAFVRLLETIDRYQEQDRFESYFFLILKRLCLNFLEKRKPEYLLDKKNFDIASNEASSREQILVEEFSQIFHTVFMRLNEKERILFYFKVYENLKYHEIANLLGLSLSDVKVSIHRGLIKLRKELEKQWIAENSGPK